MRPCSVRWHRHGGYFMSSKMAIIMELQYAGWRRPADSLTSGRCKMGSSTNNGFAQENSTEGRQARLFVGWH